MENCIVCEKPFSVVWTDTHGIATCWTCQMPYQLYFYEENKRVEKEPIPAINEKGIELAKKYWKETHKPVFPGEYDLLPNRGRYTLAELAEFTQWYMKETK